MEAIVEWAPSMILFVGGMSIVCTIIHLIQSTLRPPQCCANSSNHGLMISLPQVHPQNVFRYVRLESQKAEIDSWHQTPYPVFDV